LAFAVAASTFCPLLVLGIWWPRLTSVGAVAGLAAGGISSGTAVLATMLDTERAGWSGALLSQPAAWSVPLGFAVMLAVSLATPSRVAPNVARTMVRLHTPEPVAVDRGTWRPRGT
jgi:Na+(H+)/acetate symporter ActP